MYLSVPRDRASRFEPVHCEERRNKASKVAVESTTTSPSEKSSMIFITSSFSVRSWNVNNS